MVSKIPPRQSSETCTPFLPNGRVGTFTGVAGLAVTTAGALDCASAWLAPTTEPTPMTPSVLTKSRRETLFSFIGLCIGGWFNLVDGQRKLVVTNCMEFGSSPRHERVPFVSRFVLRADADCPQTAHGTFVFTDTAAGASCGINAGFLQAHLNRNPVTDGRRGGGRRGELH